VFVTFISVDRKSSLSLANQIYIFLRESILNGSLEAEDKLPSTRELSKTLNVSRNVIIESYEQLIAEGYVYTKDGSGTYVCKGTLLQKCLEVMQPINNNLDSKKDTKSNIVCFRTGIPDLSCIPIKKWGQFYKDTLLSLEPFHMDYQPPFGEYGLRKQLAQYLNRARGVNTTPENIIITNGAAQAFSLLCELINQSQYAVVENPLSHGILNTLKSHGINLHPIPVDSFGMITSKLPEINVKLIFTTPSHQFPTGVILPINRRIEMIQYARKHNAYIVEDDYDSEFRFNGDPIQSMQHLDPSRVIYVGTFSKTLMPALRIGYMILPDSLCAQVKEAKYTADIHSPILEQLTLEKFVESGLLNLHIRKMRKLYFKKRNYLIENLNAVFKDTVTISGADAGMHLAATFRDVIFNDNLLNLIADNGIQISSIDHHYIQPYSDKLYGHTLIFGYGNTKISTINTGVENLYKLLNSVNK